MEDVNLEEQVELKEELERDIDYTMDILLKESHEEIRQINLKAFYEKKDKMCYMVSDIGFYIGRMYRKAECAGVFSIV